MCLQQRQPAYCAQKSAGKSVVLQVQECCPCMVGHPVNTAGDGLYRGHMLRSAAAAALKMAAHVHCTAEQGAILAAHIRCTAAQRVDLATRILYSRAGSQPSTGCRQVEAATEPCSSSVKHRHAEPLGHSPMPRSGWMPHPAPLHANPGWQRSSTVLPPVGTTLTSCHSCISPRPFFLMWSWLFDGLRIWQGHHFSHQPAVAPHPWPQASPGSCRGPWCAVSP